MLLMILGLVIFLGVHCTHIFAASWRQRQIARLGLGPWKGLYALASAIGLVVMVYGYGQARQAPVVIWSPPVMLVHLNALFTLVSAILFAAAYVPRNSIKARFHHPMLLGVKAWALGHLLANGTLHDIVLFGAFLAWAVLAFIACRKRDRAEGTVYPRGTIANTAIAVVIGAVFWAIFAFYLHRVLIGVSPFA